MIGCECWDQISHAWGSDDIDLTHESKFISFFGFGFDIYLSKVNSTKDITFHRIHKTRLAMEMSYISLEYAGLEWPESKTKITLEDQFIIRPNDYFRVYACPNEYCDYNTNRKYNLERHVKTCSIDTIVVYKQSKLTDQDAREWCIQQKYISADFFPRHFACFDIESVGVQVGETFGVASKILSLQRVISVSITQTFSYGGEKTKVILRKSSSETHYYQFIEEFIAHLNKLQEAALALIPDNLTQAIAYLGDEISEFKAGNRNYSFQKIQKMRNGLNYLTGLKKLFVYGFNSQSYDLCVLFSGLLTYAGRHKQNFSVLKRGNQILSLRLG